MATLIKGHNTALLNSKEKDLECNCRAECPLDGKCRANNVVYEATVRTADSTKKYVGLTASDFKTRHASHKTSMRHEWYATRRSCRSIFGSCQASRPSTACRGQSWSGQARTVMLVNGLISASPKPTIYFTLPRTWRSTREANWCLHAGTKKSSPSLLAP